MTYRKDIGTEIMKQESKMGNEDHPVEEHNWWIERGNDSI